MDLNWTDKGWAYWDNLKVVLHAFNSCYLHGSDKSDICTKTIVLITHLNVLFSTDVLNNVKLWFGTVNISVRRTRFLPTAHAAFSVKIWRTKSPLKQSGMATSAFPSQRSDGEMLSELWGDLHMFSQTGADQRHEDSSERRGSARLIMTGHLIQATLDF